MRMILIATTAAILAPISAHAAGSCGSSVEVRRGDTLSSVAMRCDVDEQDILSSNPTVHGSRDLRVGQTLNLEQTDVTNRALDALGSATRQGSEALTGIAQDVKSSVSDLLDKNPDLKARIERLGKSIAGKVSGKPPQADVTATVVSAGTGQSIRVRADGLPSDKAVFVALGGPSSAFEVVERARTSASGSLDVTVTPPAWARDGQRLVAVVGADEAGWTMRSSTFSLANR